MVVRCPVRRLGIVRRDRSCMLEQWATIQCSGSVDLSLNRSAGRSVILIIKAAAAAAARGAGGSERLISKFESVPVSVTRHVGTGIKALGNERPGSNELCKPVPWTFCKHGSLKYTKATWDRMARHLPPQSLQILTRNKQESHTWVPNGNNRRGRCDILHGIHVVRAELYTALIRYNSTSNLTGHEKASR
jgi:hypothetical protein